MSLANATLHSLIPINKEVLICYRVLRDRETVLPYLIIASALIMWHAITLKNAILIEALGTAEADRVH